MSSTDIRFAREGYDAVKSDTLGRLAEEAPTELAGQPVVDRVTLETGDGFKFYRTDGSWLLIRFSGTEALLRVYVEARSPDDVDALLGEGRPTRCAVGFRRCASGCRRRRGWWSRRSC